MGCGCVYYPYVTSSTAVRFGVYNRAHTTTTTRGEKKKKKKKNHKNKHKKKKKKKNNNNHHHHHHHLHHHHQQQQQQQTQLYASEQKRRLQEAEELAFQQSLVQNKGLAHHLQHFDARAHKQAIAEDMEEEGLMPALRGKVQDMHSVEGLVGGRVRMRAARRGPAQAARRAQAAAVQEANQEQVFVGHAAEEEMRRRAAARQRREAPLSLGSVLAPDSDGRTLSAKDEERIRKQAMIEIMKEGDKLSKTESKNLRPENINIAHLIRQRVEQIRRYEMLRDNKELLEQITFTTSNPTSRCIDPDSEDEHEAAGLGVERFSHARDSEWNVDEEDEDDETQVTETEAELIAMISAQAKVSPCPHPETRDLNPQP